MTLGSFTLRPGRRLDPRTPVIVGVGQTLRRPDPTVATEPLDMMVDALRMAAADSGAGSALLQRADSVRVPKVVSWPYSDPGALVAERLGAAPAETVYCSDGGNTPQLLVNDAAEGIVRGERRIVLLVGAEATYTRLRARRDGVWLEWPKQAGARQTRILGETLPGVSEAEGARGLEVPIQIYPIFENALRATGGASLDAHRAKIADLWSRFSAVAAGNPHAWSPRHLAATEINTPTPTNRMIGYPYTKALCANSATDQAAAVILCSVEGARAAGVPEERWVFPWCGADTHDHWFLSQRADLHSSPGLRAAGRAALGRAGLGIDDIAHLDLYACFPSAVQVAAAELGIRLDDPGRTPTVTGGNSFAGGPGNNYVMHAIATMVDVLRADPGSVGLVTGVGWYLTKHAVGLYSTAPPTHEFRRDRPQAEVDGQPRRASTDGFSGNVTVESYTVMHDRDGAPTVALVASLTPDGRRAWGTCRKPDTLAAMTSEEFCGVPAQLGPDGNVDFS
ncbi:MAG: acetyl-CoA C-acetyltransferase [Actinomycetota bacterium]|nr:acetyl-CoA C-acetyltransferase [Actinomycetota bacterium]